ncbi:hypothetical protein [Peterkaempfera sp. SMS 1(5)a]|uniref:hypothetical protein n=1 Tax=Peterkaempfera podocarpi TaxID=3232308 RepID=UPI00366D2731
MSSESFQVDLNEVSNSADVIRRAVEELAQATSTLQAAMQRVTEAHLGHDAVGRVLKGESSGIGGITQHQDRVIKGIRDYLDNSTKVSDNLLLMCRRYAESDDEVATSLKQIHSDSNTGVASSTLLNGQVVASPEQPLRPRIGTVAPAAYETATVTPAYEVHRPEAATVTPAYEVHRPEAATVTPAYEVHRPEAATVTPAYEVHRPEAATVTPAYEVHRPDDPQRADEPGLADYTDPDRPDLDYNPYPFGRPFV